MLNIYLHKRQGITHCHCGRFNGKFNSALQNSRSKKKKKTDDNNTNNDKKKFFFAK